MKKIIAFFTALSLTFCVSAPALAADNKDMSNADVYESSGTYYGGTCDYFTRSDFTQKNTLMATQFYDEMFAFYPWEVYSWT